MQQEANEMNRPEWDNSLPTLFQCKIAFVEPSLDGTKMLANIRVGDVVEIFEAKVGPNEAYHLCRRPAQGRRPESMGWYDEAETNPKAETLQAYIADCLSTLQE